MTTLGVFGIKMEISPHFTIESDPDYMILDHISEIEDILTSSDGFSEYAENVPET